MVIGKNGNYGRNAQHTIAAMLLAALASTTAFAGRYWVGSNAGSALFSDTANWSDADGGSGGKSVPDTSTSSTYWTAYKNGLTLFDTAAAVANVVYVGTSDSRVFVWRATDHSYGLTADGKEFQLGYSSRTPDYLLIDGGTYIFGTMRLGYTANCTVGLTITNDVDITCTSLRIVSGNSGVNSTFTVNGGVVKTTNTGNEALSICNNANTIGTLVVDGGTVDTTSGYASMGYVADSTSTVHIVSGAWNTKGIRIGGRNDSMSPRNVKNAVARFVIDGGTFSVAAESGIGYCTNTGSYAEMVINGGTVNCNHESFYVADAGPGKFTMNGGTFTMPNSSYGVTIGHKRNGADVGIVVLNGGVLTTGKLRTQYSQPGSRITFNGGTVKPTRSASDFLEENENIVCEVQEGGLVVDTAGFNVTIAHDIVGTGPLVKKGDGKLTLTGTTPFTTANTTVLGGSVSIVPSAVDGSAGGDLGTIVMHGLELDGWLKDPDIYSYTSTYGAKGTAALERPTTVKVKVNGEVKAYENLEIGITTNDTFNGVSYSFTTENVAPRTLSVFSTVNNKAIANVRDCGSWPIVSVDGTKKMNQGVIFRGGHLDPFVNATAEQKAASVLAGLKTEIDLRHVDSDNDIAAEYQTATYAVEKSWAAVDCDYFPCPLNYNKGCTQIDTSDASFTNEVRRMFSKLGTSGALPAYFHCRIGTDRTGIMGLLLLGMMGADEECLYRDYLMSNFASIGGSRNPDVPEKFLRYIHRGNCNSGKYVYSNNNYGKSVAARCRAYLEMCGVTQAELGNITMALSGETPDQVLARVDAYEAANGVRTVSYLSVPGSSSTNAVHRLPAGRHILPHSNPTRDHYVFAGWDTENEVDNGDGTATVYAKWEVSGYERFWAAGNGASESFASYASWSPAPPATGFMSGDTLVLNKGVDKVAVLADGDSVAVEQVYVGWGYNGSSTASSYDAGGRLDVTGGRLEASGYLYIGGPSSSRSNNVVNVTGGLVKAGTLHMSEASSNSGNKCDTLNISGAGVVEVGSSDNTHFGQYKSGLSYVNVTDGGTFLGLKQVDIGYAGRSYVRVDGGTVDLGGNVVNVGRNAGSSSGSGYGQLVVTNGTWTCGHMNVGKGDSALATGEVFVQTGGAVSMSKVLVGHTMGTGLFVVDGGTVDTTAESTVGNDAACTGTLHIVSGTFNAAGDTFRIGRNGWGVLTMDGGTLNGVKDLKLGTSGTAGYGEVNLNGGTINAGKITTSTTSAQTMNWNGGTLSCNGTAGTDAFFPANAYVTVNVLDGGAIYETAAGRESESVAIAQPMSGTGAFVKRGGGTLSLTGALDLKGGFRIEGGTLKVNSLSRTCFDEISVGAGCTLDLNGASVVVPSYKVAGVAKDDGTYNECNGTITVMSSSVTVADGTSIDLGGESWTFETIKGSGTINNADITVTGTVEPGLTVGGTMTFAPGAKFDITPCDSVAVGTSVVFLTAESIENWPTLVSSGTRKATLSLVDNGDGTVSLVGTLATPGSDGRYWLGNNNYWSDTDNWAETSGGTKGASVPGDGATGVTYWRNYRNGKTIFDAAATIPDGAYIGTGSSDFFVWDATDPANGLTTANSNGIRIGAISGKSPTYLQIDGGTYTTPYLRLGYVDNVVAGLTINGGTLNAKKTRVSGGKSGVNGTLIMNGGTLKSTGTDGDNFMICDQANTVGTMIINGGTLDTTSCPYAQIGGMANITATIFLRGGTWNTKSFILGGKSQGGSSPTSVDNSVARLIVDGGTLAASANCYIGSTAGTGTLSEMIVSNGVVNINADNLYVGEMGPGALTMEGGELNIRDSESYGINIGHKKTGYDVGTVTLNGGVLTARKFRIDYVQPGSRLTFNGGTLRATRATSGYLDANANLTCEVQEGGLVFDTAGFDVTIKHDLVGSGPIVKKGAGTLTINGAHPFTSDGIIVYEGKLVLGSTTYNAQRILDASEGGDLGEVVLHDEPLESWLKDPDMTTYTSKYGAAGTAALELPLDVAVTANGKIRKYENLETGRRYEETFNGVTYSFTTESLAPRTLKVLSTASTSDGGKAIKNVRDVGSWPIVSVDGTKKMNQGVIFRGAKLDYFANTTAEEKSASWFAGLKTEVDLRRIDELNSGYQTLANEAEAGGSPKSWAAVDADYLFCPMNGTQINATESGNFTNQLHRMFSRLGTPGALPAYFHCAIGTDRTGITGMLLLGMMGVEEETLYRDYLMSNFANIGGSRNTDVPETFLRYIHRGSCNSGKYVYSNNNYGKSVAARCRAYLEMCGVTTEEIGNITMALSGETPDQVLARVDAYEAANGVRTVSYVPYPGSTDTNAIHRLPAGEHIFPSSTPSRSGYVFTGWDTDNEANGIVYAAWKRQDVRYWADSNGATESFTRAESWNPAPSGDFSQDDILALNKGIDKIALLSEGAVTVDTLYLGWGSLDGGESSSTSNDHGGRLDMTGGTLNVTNYLYLGGYRSAKNISNVANVSGGTLSASRLRIGTYAAQGDKCDTLNISGSGVVAATVDEVKVATYESDVSAGCINIRDGGTFASSNHVKVAIYGRGSVSMENGATLTLPASSLYIGYDTAGYGEMSVDGSNVLAAKLRVGDAAAATGTVEVVNHSTLTTADEIRVGRNGKGVMLIEDSEVSTYDFMIAGDGSGSGLTSVGSVTIGGDSVVSASNYLYVGQAGDGELTINGGQVNVGYVFRLGDNNSSGNRAVFNFNGGTLRAAQFGSLGSPNASFYWNGGTLECANDRKSGLVFPANTHLEVVVKEGGAIYNAVTCDTEEIAHPLSGVGSFTKKGGKALTVSGAVDLDGGFVVEEGTLTLSNVVGTEFAQLSVADGATLDLNGAEVTVDEYVLGGVKQRGGKTYTAHNGTIHVKSSGESFGGLVIDTAGSNRTISEDIVLPEGTAPQLIKKGGGRLTLSGNTPFTAENIFVCEGSVKFNGKTYNVNVGTNFVVTTGGDLGLVDIHGETLEGWLDNPDFATYSSVYGAKGTTTLEQPLGVVVEVDGVAKGYINLETGKTYSDALGGVSYSFTVEDHAPRTMKVISPVSGSAIINIRDVGSWPLVSVDGTAKMNQGVIFRGGKLDSFVNSTAEQRASSVLAGLKTEIDLRKLSEIDPGYTNVTKSWAAVDANYYHFSYVDATQLDATDSGNFTNQVRNVFSTLGTPGALPAYFHCVIGTDRTGITGRLLLGLMGVEEEVIYRDYLMSNFANIGGSRSPDVTEKTLRHLLRGDCNSKKYVYNTKDGTYGASVASRCRQYLEMCGVTTEEISNITMALSGETADQVLARVNAYEAANGVRTVSYVPYPGSTDTNAMHRLPAGKHIFPTSTPSRSGYVFTGWDTDNEANGIVYAAWKKQDVRYWADSNGATESFTRTESWNPAPAGDFGQDDILVLNKGIDKIALLSEGAATVDTLYVGWGSFDGGETYIGSSDTSDRCGRLDVVDGLLNVTNYLYVGGYRTTKNISSTVNVSGGRVVAGRLYVGDYSTTGNRCDAFNITGTGVVEVTSGEIRFASEYDSGGAVASLRIGDYGVLRGLSDARFGKYGSATAVLEDNATLDVSGKTVYLANGGGTYGGLSLAGSASLLFNDMWVGYSGSSTGKVVVADNGSIAASHYIYIGRKGSGELTVNGGEVAVNSAIQFGVDGASGNDTVLNLNGGRLSTRQMKVLGSPNAVFNWNGGVLEYSAASGDSTADIMPDSALVVNVLEGGAIYNAVVRSNEQINHSLSGVGTLTKTGSKQLTVSGAVNLAGGFVVEEGKLTLSNVVGTEFAKLSVATGATLDLNGAEVTVDKYVLGGVKQRGGKTYIAHNGTINVKFTGPIGGMVFIR